MKGHNIVLCLILIKCFVSVVSSAKSEGEITWPQHFKLGLLAPWNGSFEDFSALTSASAISIAMEDINSDPILGKIMNFSVVTLDSGCNSKTAAGNTIRMFMEHKVDAYIGPPCSVACRPAGEIASFFDKPIISWVATDPDFNDKSVFTTLGRSLGPFNKMAVFLVDIFKQYNWRRVAIISSNFYLWLDAGKAMRRVFKDSNITVGFDANFERFPPDNFIRRTLIKASYEARIFILVVPKEDRRRFMVTASLLGMTKGEYVFYTIEMLPEENVLNPDDVWFANDGMDAIAQEAFKAVFHVTLAALTGTQVNVFRKEVARRMREPPWSDMIGKSINMGDFTYGDKYSPFLYDSVMLYAVALNETIRKGQDFRKGSVVASNMRFKMYQGMTGKVILDSNGDREPDYWITDMVENGSFIKIAEVLNTDKGGRIFRKDVAPPRWPGDKIGQEYAPPDTPLCGFRGELCKSQKTPDWVIILGVFLSCAAIGAGSGLTIFIYRRQKFENQLLEQSWRIQWEEIEPINRPGKSTSSVKSGSSASNPSLSSTTVDSKDKDAAKDASSINKSVSDSKSDSHSRSVPSMGTGQGQIFSDIGMHKAVVVALKHIKKEHMQVTRQVLVEFNELKDIVHENLNIFVGACVDPPNICLIWHYCPKGSLQDVLGDEAFKLDNSFKLSFMTDIARGLHYIHSTHMGSHGNLKSSNCLVDARWTVKVTDYGLPSFLSGQDFNETEVDVYKRKLWVAPELLRENFPPPRGTQKGDVYSFAIISYEIMMRSEPYNFENFTPRDVVNRVRNGESIPYRPALPEVTELGKRMIDMLKTCWDENADSRPNFLQIRGLLRKMAGGQEINIMDNVLQMMEKYAYNLEEIVEERTQQLVEEKKKTDSLLYRMLPSTVAEQLKLGKFVQPENYDQSSLYFSDIVGFTTLASDSSPMQIVDFLNDLYSCFDNVIAQHDVYKVETIGDAYMVVSGVPVRNGSRHISEIANVSLDLLSAVTHFHIRHRPRQQLKLRIGLHTGPVVAGVVGNIMPRYCLFGDAVNTAARMESSGKPLRIHVSKAIYIGLTEVGGFEMTSRGEMTVKGKGLQMTYWLHGKKGFDKPLPTFDKSEVAKERGHDDRQDSVPRHALMQGYDSYQSQDSGNATGGMPQVV